MSIMRPTLPTTRIKIVGIFDLDKVMRGMQKWIVDQGYEFQENQFKHKVPSPAGAEWEVRWKSWRKVTGYTKFWINIFFHIWDMKEVEVIKDGKKQKLTKARMLIEFYGEVELDYDNKMEGSVLKEALREFYHKFVIKRQIDGGWEDELYYRIYKLHRWVKEWLDFETKANAAAIRY